MSKLGHVVGFVFGGQAQGEVFRVGAASYFKGHLDVGSDGVSLFFQINVIKALVGGVFKNS